MASAVQSVAGRTGAVVLTAADVQAGVFDPARLGTGDTSASAVLHADGVFRQPQVSSGGAVSGGFSETVGDGSETSFVVTHGLAAHVMVQAVNVDTGAYVAPASVTATSNNALTVTFSTAPAAGGVRVLVLPVAPAGAAIITRSAVTATVSGQSVQLGGQVSASAPTTLSRARITVLSGTDVAGAVAAQSNVTVPPALDLSGSLTLPPGEYTAVVSTSNDGGATWVDGPATAVTVEAPATGTGSAYPSREVAVYHLLWSNSANGGVAALPSSANVVHLWSAQQAGSGALSLLGYGPDGRSGLLSALQARRTAGTRVVLALGHGSFDLSATAARVADVQAIANDLGGLDGIIWCASTRPDQAQFVAFAQALRAAFGPGFGIAVEAIGSGFTAWAAVGAALNTAGCLDSFGHVFYWSEPSLNNVRSRMQFYIDSGIPAGRLCVALALPGGKEGYTGWSESTAVTNVTALKNEFGITRVSLRFDTAPGSESLLSTVQALYA